MHAFFRYLVVIVTVFGFSCQALFVSAATPCDVRILEIATVGMLGETFLDREAQDMIIVQNLNLTTSATVKAVYMQSNGVPSELLTFSLGNVPAGGIKMFVSPALEALNPEATVVGNMSFASAGGTVRVERSSGGTYCDMLGWGDAVMSEGDPAPVIPEGATLVRSQDEARSPVDSDNNLSDFSIMTSTCMPPEFREIQPFVTDESGASLAAWVEVFGTREPVGDCVLSTHQGERYTISALDLPLVTHTTTISQGYSVDGHVVPLHLGEDGGQLWFSAPSYFGDELAVNLPLATVQYPVIARGQTWSLIDGLWRQTYVATPDSENKYGAEPTVPDDMSGTCDSVRINEILPNPNGEDTGGEWIELVNTRSDIIMLADCQIVFDGVAYGFSSFDGLAPHEIRTFKTFYDVEDGSAQGLRLRNSSDIPLMMSWEVRLASSLSEVVQSLYLYELPDNTNAPSGQSWAWFEDGWRWTEALTPGNENLKALPKKSAVPTDFTAVLSETVDTSGGKSAAAGRGSAAPLSSLVSLLPPSGPPIEITELLPNPAAPAKDANDEYVEIYNPNDVAVDLVGYKLQTGQSFTRTYTFPQVKIEPKSYLVITSGATSISLSNTEGRARLLDRAGKVVSRTDSYHKAPDGSAWALINGTWQWTTTPTRGAANRSGGPASNTTLTNNAKDAGGSSNGSVKSASTGTGGGSGSAGVEEAAQASVHGLVLAGVGLVAVLYAAYEYRTDIANRIYQFRSNRAARRASRQRTSRRRDN